MITTALIHDPYASSRLLLSTARSRLLPLRHSLLLLHHHVPNPNPCSYNAAIAASLSRSSPSLALPLYSSMLARASCAPDVDTHPLLARASSARLNLREGAQVHAHIVRMGFCLHLRSVNTLLHLYSLCASPGDARKLFDESPIRDVVSWNTILGAYVKAGDVERACWMFSRMPERDMVASNSMIALLGGEGMVLDARMLFDKMPERDFFSWTAMVSAYERNGLYIEAVEVFTMMVNEGIIVDEIAAICAVSACARLAAVTEGRMVHGFVMKEGIASYVNLHNALINMYFCCGDITTARSLFDHAEIRDQVSWNSMISGHLKHRFLDDAKLIFDSMPQKDTVSWSTMLSGYAQHDRFLELLELFEAMRLQSVKPDETTLVSVLLACAHLSLLEQGRSLHAFVMKFGYKVSVIIGTALVDMYMKCGGWEDAIGVFNSMEECATSTWNALIMGLAMNGLITQSLERFEQMKCFGVTPNEITFTGVLGACRHAGLVDKGREYFNAMLETYNIEPNIRHYGCMVDLLGRAGLLEEAEDLIRRMPMTPDVTTLSALLGASCKHGNLHIGSKIGRKLIEREPGNDAFHVLLSNIYAYTGSWDDTLQVRGAMIESGVSKSPGRSLMEVGCVAD